MGGVLGAGDLKLILTGGMFTALVIAAFIWRSGSATALLDRLWRAISKRSKIADKEIRGFHEECSDVDNFQFIYRMNLGTVGEIKRFLLWVRSNDLPPAVVGRARRWLVFGTEISIRSPRIRDRLVLAIFIVISIAVLTLPALWLVGKDDMLVRVKASGNYYWINDSKGVSFGEPVFDVSFSSCSTISGGELKEDMSVLCQLSGQSDFGAIFEKNISVQKYFGMFLLIVSLMIVAACHYRVRGMDAAEALVGRLESAAKSKS